MELAWRANSDVRFHRSQILITSLSLKESGLIWEEGYETFDPFNTGSCLLGKSFEFVLHFLVCHDALFVFSNAVGLESKVGSINLNS